MQKCRAKGPRTLGKFYFRPTERCGEGFRNVAVSVHVMEEAVLVPKLYRVSSSGSGGKVTSGSLKV